MSLLALPGDPPDENGHILGSSQVAGDQGDATVSLDELLAIGEEHYASHAARRRSPRTRAWLRRAAAVTTKRTDKPARRLVTMAFTMASSLVFIDGLAPEAMPAVCSTMMLVMANEFVRIFRQRRSVATAG